MPDDNHEATVNNVMQFRGKRASHGLGGYAQLMEHYALQYATNMVWDCLRMQPMRVADLRHAFGNAVVREWLDSPGRRLIYEVRFDPGADADPDALNLFRGFAIEPKEGDFQPMLDLLMHLCSESADTDLGRADLVAWLLRWLALPLQQPGTKMHTALVFHGPEGAGKNQFFEGVASIYGQHAGIVGQYQLESQFNDWASGKLLVIGDEVVTRQETRHHKGGLKALVTGSVININAKMQPLRQERNCMNLVFLSNELQPLALDEGDRRYAVVYTPPPREKAFYARVGAWMKAGGMAAFMHYLLGLDLADFHAWTPPPLTKAKADLIELGLSAPDRFAKEWLAQLIALPVAPCTHEQLFSAYRKWCDRTGVPRSGEQAAFSRAVARTGRDRLLNKQVNLLLPSGSRKTARCWIPRDALDTSGMSEGAWMQARAEDFAQMLRDFRGEDSRP